MKACSKRNFVLTCLLLFTLAPIAKADGPATSPAPPAVFSAYGFVLPTWIGASAGVESFSQPNLSAYTAAGNPVMASEPTQSRSSFQVAQSRFGFLLKPEARSTGRLEFDFIDFTKSSPTTSALPRVRRATVDYQADDDVLLRFGQDWDLVSPLGPHSYNYVGHYFESGDVAFMRIQAQVLVTSGAWEHALALGLPGNNNAAADQQLELGRLPTLALRETYHWASGQAGVSGLVTSLRKDKVTNDAMLAGVISGFVEIHPAKGLEVRSETYFGQNTHNLGMLGLAFGSAASPTVKEAGAYVTAKYQLTPHAAVFGGAGAAFAVDPSQVLASYTTTAGGVSSLAGTGPGIETNFTLRIGYEWNATSAITFFGEVAGLSTKHRLLPADLARFDTVRQAVIGQFGTQLSF